MNVFFFCFTFLKNRQSQMTSKLAEVEVPHVLENYDRQIKSFSSKNCFVKITPLHLKFHAKPGVDISNIDWTKVLFDECKIENKHTDKNGILTSSLIPVTTSVPPPSLRAAPNIPVRGNLRSTSRIAKSTPPGTQFN